MSYMWLLHIKPAAAMLALGNRQSIEQGNIPIFQDVFAYDCQVMFILDVVKQMPAEYAHVKFVRAW